MAIEVLCGGKHPSSAFQVFQIPVCTFSSILSSLHYNMNICIEIVFRSLRTVHSKMQC